MLVFELLQLEKQKKIKGHTKKEANLLFMNTETNLDNLKLEFHQLQEIYNTLDININNYLNNEILLNCFYMERDHLYKSYNIYKDTDIISNGRELVEINKEFVTVSNKLKTLIDKIIKELESKANKHQKTYIKKVKESKFYNIES